MRVVAALEESRLKIFPGTETALAVSIWINSDPGWWTNAARNLFPRTECVLEQEDFSLSAAFPEAGLNRRAWTSNVSLGPAG
jgi:hypothetical protein